MDYYTFRYGHGPRYFMVIATASYEPDFIHAECPWDETEQVNYQNYH